MKRIKPLIFSGIVLLGWLSFDYLAVPSLVSLRGIPKQSRVVESGLPRGDASRNDSPLIGGDVGTKNRQEYDLVRVVDGDTIEVSRNGQKIKVRMIGINAPESVDPRRPVQCFGQEASAHLKSLLEEETMVELELDSSQGTLDKYGRTLAYVFLPGGQDLNKQMITDGYAYEYTYNLPYHYQAEYKSAERLARMNKIGLWADGTCKGEL